MNERSHVVEVMIRAATRAGDALLARFRRPDRVAFREKGAADFVSEADIESQEVLQSDLSAMFPDHGFLLEEESTAKTTGAARFVADPLDGTTNFVHGIPHFAVSIALEVGGVATAGVIVDPAKGEIFWTEQGRGAWLGERRLQVSREIMLERAVIGTGIPHHGRGDHPRYLAALATLMRDVAGVRRFGAAALDLAYVAAGRYEAFFEQGLAPWDVGAGALLVQEAGGVVSRTDGRVEHFSGDVLASCSAPMHERMLQILSPLHTAPGA